MTDLVLRGHYMPGASDTSWIVFLGPVGCFESPRRLVQSAPTVLVTCKDREQEKTKYIPVAVPIKKTGMPLLCCMPFPLL